MEPEHDQNAQPAHWTRVYRTRAPDEVSWFQSEPALSVELVRRAASPPAAVLDVGAGTSFLVERLHRDGYQVGALDISDEPLRILRERLGDASQEVAWFVADVCSFASPHTWNVWHDRAVFHFLTTPEARTAYRGALMKATAPGAAVIIATFGPAGPTRCSGLPTCRYSPEELSAELGPRFDLTDVAWEDHATPTSATQQFVYCVFRRR